MWMISPTADRLDSCRYSFKKTRTTTGGIFKEGRCMLLLLAIAAASSNDCGFDSYVGGKLSKERLISDYIKKAR